MSSQPESHIAFPDHCFSELVWGLDLDACVGRAWYAHHHGTRVAVGGQFIGVSFLLLDESEELN